MKAAELVVRCLEEEGVKLIFGLPGEENLDVVDALIDSRLRFVTVRHEQAAAFMADVFGRLSGRAGVCLATLGPGATNLATGVADANLDRAPLVAITGQAGLDRMHKESHQVLDLVGFFRPITKWNAQVRRARVVPEVVRKAFKLAQTEKKGATHIDLPEDEMREQVNAAPLPARQPPLPEPLTAQVERAATLIAKAEYPMILAGLRGLWLRSRRRGRPLAWWATSRSPSNASQSASPPRKANYRRRLRETVLAELERHAGDPSVPLKPQRIMHDLREVLPPDDILVSDVGAHKLWIARMYPCYVPNTAIISNGFGAMGIAVPGAIAAKLVHPGRRVVAVTGDGGFLMNAQELETAVREHTPFVTLVLTDGRYGAIEWKPRYNGSGLNLGLRLRPRPLRDLHQLGPQIRRVEPRARLEHVAPLPPPSARSGDRSPRAPGRAWSARRVDRPRLPDRGGGDASRRTGFSPRPSGASSFPLPS